MAKWNYRIDISDFYHSEEITIEQKAHKVAERLTNRFGKTLLNVESEYFDEYLEQIRDMFQDFIGDDVEEFDDIMEELYDWGDIEVTRNVWPKHRLCWIKTI